MANEELVALVKQGPGAWNAWRLADPQIPLGKVDLSGADLVGADLIGTDLREANLVGAHLRKANLSSADIRQLRTSLDSSLASICAYISGSARLR